MKYTEITHNGEKIVIVDEDMQITDEQTALDLMMSVAWLSEAQRIVLRKEHLSEDFFDLSTKLAGGILQKAVNYKVKLAVVGDFSSYTSKAWKDFVRECNAGQDFCFVENIEQAITFFGRPKDDLDRYAELVIAQMMRERQIAEELSDDERFRMEHTSNQRRFEYDYEEDLYEPIYDDED